MKAPIIEYLPSRDVKDYNLLAWQNLFRRLNQQAKKKGYLYDSKRIAKVLKSAGVDRTTKALYKPDYDKVWFYLYEDGAFEIKYLDPIKSSNKCICDISQLMVSGCDCGGE